MRHHHCDARGSLASWDLISKAEVTLPGYGFAGLKDTVREQAPSQQLVLSETSHLSPLCSQVDGYYALHNPLQFSTH